MTKFGIIADAHVANHKRWGGPIEGGLNRRGRDCVRTVGRAAKEALKQKAEALFVLGDLFDGTRPSPPLVYATSVALGECGREVFIILGNHDKQSEQEIDHACASMALQSNIKVISRPEVITRAAWDCDVGCVPYVAGDAKDWLTAGMARLSWGFTKKRRAVFTHLGIYDDHTPAYMKSAKDAISIGHARWLMDAHNVDALIAGNWHSAQKWSKDNRLVGIPGTVCPASFSDPQRHGVLALYESLSNAMDRVEICTPLFIKLDGVSELGTMLHSSPVSGAWGNVLARHYSEINEPVPTVYVRCRLAPKDMVKAIELQTVLQAKYPGMLVHLEADEEPAKASVKEAAKAIARTGSSTALVESYADLANVAEPGTKEGVARRLEEYRKAAQ